MMHACTDASSTEAMMYASQVALHAGLVTIRCADFLRELDLAIPVLEAFSSYRSLHKHIDFHN